MMNDNPNPTPTGGYYGAPQQVPPPPTTPGSPYPVSPYNDGRQGVLLPAPIPGQSFGPGPEPEPSGLRRVIHYTREILLTGMLVLIVVFASRQVVQNVEVQGISMLPTLRNNELILVDTISYRLHAPRHGDIIIFHPPLAITEDYVKRVIGVPGDVVEVRQGQVYVNGTLNPEPYITQPHTYSWGPGRVPAGKLFVLGDNRNLSYDSHMWRDATGPIPYLSQNEVIGRAMVSYWPLKSLHFFAAPIVAAGLPLPRAPSTR